MEKFRKFSCGCCGTDNIEGEKFRAICGYKILCVECLNKLSQGLWVSTEETARDNALPRKDDKADHRYNFILKLSGLNHQSIGELLVGYNVTANEDLGIAILEKQTTNRQFAKLGKMGKVEIKVEDTLTGLQTTVYTTEDATDIQSYGMGYKFNWV